MACAAPTTSSTKETTNYARLCRLLVDVGTQALRDTFDAIHPPANLHAVLATNKATLQSLRTRKIINATQWGKLFPAISTSVSSANFDITLSMVLLRNFCGLPSPAAGWDTLPAVADVSREADIARVKYYRNTVYAHAERASVDDATFNTYWRDIRDTLVRLGGVKYRAAIDNLETECMDPEIEDHFKELLRQWKKDEDNVKEKLDEVIKKLDDLANTAFKKEITITDKGSRSKEMKHKPVICTEKYHENEPVEYYCQECQKCICLKCGQTRHNQHIKMDIQQAAEDEKRQMTQVFRQAKLRVANIETKMKEQIELMTKSTEKISAAEKKVTETVKEIIRIAREHETAVKTELAEIKEAQQRDHETKMETFQLLAAEIKNSVQHGEDIVQRNNAPEILQAGNAVLCCCKKLFNSPEIKIYNPQHIGYRVNIETMNSVSRLVPGQVVIIQTDSSQSAIEGKGLKEAELGAETNFTLTTRDSEGNQFYNEQDQVTVQIRSPTGEDKEKKIEDCKDGNYTVRYKPKSVGLHDITVEVNSEPLTGNPWSVQVTGHQYKALHSFGSRGKGLGEFDGPRSIAASERTGNIAVADYYNKRVQLFDSELKYLRTIGDKGSGAERINYPVSVAFTASGDVIVIHGEVSKPCEMFLFTEHGQFIKHISQHLIDPSRVSVRTDGHLIVCDWGDNSIKVLSPDGTELLQSFSAPDFDKFPWFAVCHQDMFFVCYGEANFVKVFSKEGVFLYDIGSEGSGDGQLRYPDGLTIDKFNNLIVCDKGNRRLQVFSLDGKFINSINEGLNFLFSVAINKDGTLLVCDWSKHCIHVFQ